MAQPIIEDINQHVAEELLRLRKSNGFTSYENFAIENGFARKHYWMVEKGMTRITLEYLHRVLKCHNLSLADFFKSINI